MKMKRLCFVIALLVTFLNVYSQEPLINEPQDSTKIQNETNKIIINPNDELILEPNENVWTYGISKAYYTGGNVGIGTSSPLYKLHTQGDIYATGIMRTDGAFQVGPNGNRFVVNTSGNVGIGITNPQSKLSVNGGQTWDLGTNKNIKFTNWDISGNGCITLSTYIDDNSAHIPLSFAASSFYFHGGKVGIGTSNPQEALSVNGKITCEGIEVLKDVPYSDYVFDDNYKLRTLAEVESFIKEKKHLPEVPSAQEFKENGYNIGEMDDLLLRKVEELTLYIIELKKENEELKKLFNESISK